MSDFFADDEHTHGWDSDEGKPGIMLAANAIQFWSVRHYEARTQRHPTVRETALAFKMTDADVRQAVEAHPFMFLSGPDDPTEQRIEHDGE